MHSLAVCFTRLFCLLLLVSLCACAARQQPVDPAMAGNVWQSMLARSATEKTPYRDNMSLRFGTEGNTRRVLAIIWGNGEDDLRLDVSAGVGTTVAMLHQKGQEFLLYAPMEQKAYFHEGESSPLLKLGLPLPFDLFRLEALLHNRWAQVFGKTWQETSGHSKGIAYALQEGIGGTLVLDAQGMPVLWENKNWSIAFSFKEDGTLKRLDLANKKGEKGILLLRSQEHPARFDAAQMQLELPQDTVLLPLESLKRNK